MVFKEGYSISSHLNEFENVVNQSATMKIAFYDELPALLILSSLQNSWKTQLQEAITLFLDKKNDSLIWIVVSYTKRTLWSCEDE